MRRLVQTLLVAGLVAVAPAAVSAQGIGVGAKVGTMGIGADVGLALNDAVVLRGGLGYFPIDYDLEADDITYGLSLPGINGMLGVDFHVLGPLKLMGGLFYKSDGLEGSASVSAGDEIGDLVLTESGTVTANLGLGTVSPYVGLGLGKLVGGFGFYLDVAVAFTGEPDLTLTASDNLNAIPDFTQELEQERQNFLEDVPDNIPYPIIQLGVKFGLGG